jgi:transcriptional regulator with XRE-family HTH domain
MIAERLKQERERLALTQDEFSAAAGAKRRTLVDWEKGVSSPTAMQLAELQTIGVDVAYVVTGERQGHGIGEAAVHQAVIDAVDLLSLEKSRCAATSQSGR